MVRPAGLTLHRRAFKALAMENIDPQHTESGAAPKPIEKDYESHKEDPGPAKPAVTEKDENGGGQALKWVLPLAVIIGLIIWFIMRK